MITTMEKFIAILCLTTLCVLGQDSTEELSVEFTEKTPKFFDVGDKHVFECKVNRSLKYLFEYGFYILKKRSDGTEVILYSGMQRKEDAKPEYYDLKIGNEDNYGRSTFKFEMKSVQEGDEGELVCRVGLDKQGQFKESVVKIDIYRDIDMVSLKFDQYDEISMSETSPYEMDAGTYPATCVAMGSNPSVTNLKLYFNDKPIEANLETMQMDSEEHRYKTMLTASVKVQVEDSGKKLECVALRPFQREGVEQMISVSVPIKVMKYDPEIMCHKASAYEGMMYPKLKCEVKHAGLDIKEFRYRIKNPEMNKNIQIRVDEVGEDNSKVKKETNGEDSTTVTLVLYLAEGWHFDSEFFLEVENSNGYVSQVPVTLVEIPDPNNGSAFKLASVSMVLLSTLLAAGL